MPFPRFDLVASPWVDQPPAFFVFMAKFGAGASASGEGVPPIVDRSAAYSAAFAAAQLAYEGDTTAYDQPYGVGDDTAIGSFGAAVGFASAGRTPLFADTYAYEVSVEIFEYKIAWYSLGSSYLKVTWDEVTEDSVMNDGVTTVESTITVAKTFTAPPVNIGGVSVPAGFALAPTLGPWNVSDVQGTHDAIELPEAAGDFVTRSVYLDHLRWSFVRGYFPAGDQPNGFPG